MIALKYIYRETNTGANNELQAKSFKLKLSLS